MFNGNGLVVCSAVLVKTADGVQNIAGLEAMSSHIIATALVLKLHGIFKM